jgi:superfamily II DNA or RNA helicase
MQYETMNNSSRDKSNRLEMKINGRIFPSWVLKNFKNYTLPEIIRDKNEDPCQEKISNELEPYQKFVGQFINYRSPFSDILLFHGLGSGKTATAINIYNVLYNFTPKWNVFVIIPASLKSDPWLKELENRLSKSDKILRMIEIF